MDDCKSCAKPTGAVPYIAHEAAMARAERSMKRLIAALIAVLLLWFATIGMFVYYLNQFDFFSEQTVTVDATDGPANYIGNDGDIINGENSR